MATLADAAHKTKQPNNRITRYNTFWSSLKRSGILAPEGHSIHESTLIVENGLRGFGAICFDVTLSDRVHSFMLASQAALIFLPKEQDHIIPMLVHKGWPMKNTKPPEEILELVSNDGGIIIDVFGEFDDRAVSVAAIAKRRCLNNLRLGSTL